MDKNKWDYKVVRVCGSEQNQEEELVEYGNDGWELVGVTNNGSTQTSTAYLKRPYK